MLFVIIRKRLVTISTIQCHRTRQSMRVRIKLPSRSLSLSSYLYRIHRRPHSCTLCGYTASQRGGYANFPFHDGMMVTSMAYKRDDRSFFSWNFDISFRPFRHSALYDEAERLAFESISCTPYSYLNHFFLFITVGLIL